MKKSLLILLFALGVSYLGLGQTYLISEGFSTTSLPSGWSGDVYFNSTANHGTLSGGNGAGFNLSLKYLQTPLVNTAGTLTFWMKGSAATSQISFRVLKRINGGSWSPIGDYPKPHTSTWTERTIVIDDISNNIEIKFEAYDRTGNSIYLDDIQLTNYSGGGNISPVITNIIQTPSSGITSITPVSVSADVTDSDGTVEGVELHWGTTSGSLGNTISMANSGGDTYTTDPDVIPAQINGSTVYYEVYALDDDAGETTSPEQSYDVVDPVTTPLPYTQTFDTDLGDCLAYSVAGGTKNWIWDNMGGLTDGHAYMNGYAGSNPEEDWLILPGINLNNYSNEIMQFYTFYEYGNDDADNYLKLFYSTNYAGVGDPTAATWTELSFIKAGNPAAWQPSYIVDLSAISGINVYIGFKYYSTAAPRSWRVDDITIFEGTQVDVTFQVNMAEQTVSGDGVHLAGSFNNWWDPAAIEMLDGDLDNIYTVTLPLYSGIEYQFKYINGNAWGSDEMVPAACQAPGTSNRFEIIGGANYSLDPVCFSSCVNCGVLSFFDITFRVDMKNETVLGGVNIAGSFNGWGNTPMNNVSGAIWEVTLSLQETSYQEYKFKNGSDGWENFDGSCLASSWGNRYINIPSANTTLDLVCFNSCEACPVADFVMINEVDSDTPGTDALEFVELYDGGVGNTDLTGLVLVFYNGSNDLSYAAYDLDGYSTDVNGYFLLGNAAVVPTPSIIFAGNILQNGQDAVALYVGDASSFPANTAVTTTNLMDALVYDTDDADDPGLLVLLNPGEPQINENGRFNMVNHSCQRIPNGSGGQRNTSTYDQAFPTPGAMNYPVYTNWTGLIGNSWDEAGNWDYGVPTIVKDATIPNVAKAPFPLISGSASCANLTMNVGSGLEIGPSGSLTVSGTFTNNGSLTIKSDATGTGSLIENNGVSATVERYLTQDKWHYVSAPVDNPTANVFLGIYMMEWNEPTGAWSYITDPAYVMATDMEGFAVWSQSGMTGNTTVSFAGNLNTGAKSIAATAAGPVIHNGFNFAGNPYPSSLDWNVDDGSGWSRTAGNIEPTLYIWNHTYLNYGVYVKDGATGTLDVDNIIPPHQGFFVHCSAATGTLGVNNSARIHASKDILKSGETDNSLLKFRIEGNNYADEMIIRVDPMASIQLDQMDATKFHGSEAAPQMYSLSKDNKELSINSFPDSEDYKVIPVGMEAGVNDVYTLTVSDFGSFDPSVNLYLEDLLEGTFTKIEENTVYSFSAGPNDEPIRFLLHMNGILAVPDNNFDINDVKVYSYDQDVYVTSQEGLNGLTVIYDLLGREIVKEKLNGETMKKFDLSGQHGYMIVRVSSDKGNLNQKVYIR